MGFTNKLQDRYRFKHRKYQASIHATKLQFKNILHKEMLAQQAHHRSELFLCSNVLTLATDGSRRIYNLSLRLVLRDGLRNLGQDLSAMGSLLPFLFHFEPLWLVLHNHLICNNVFSWPIKIILWRYC